MARKQKLVFIQWEVLRNNKTEHLQILRRMDMKQGRPKRVKAGMHRFNAPYSICPFVKQQKIIKAKQSNAVDELSHLYNCNTTNIILFTS